MNAPWVVAQPQVAPYNVLQKPHRLTLDQLAHHVAQHRSDRVEPLIGLTDVGQSELVEQDLLDDEDGDRFGQLRARLHDAKAEGDDLGRQEEVDDGGVIVLLESGGVARGTSRHETSGKDLPRRVRDRTNLDQGSDDSKTRQSEVLKRPGLAGRVKERVEEERDVGVEEERPGFRVGSDALKESKGVADSVGRMGGES